MTPTALQENTRKRESLHKRVAELDAALLEHHRRAAEEQIRWRAEEADLLRQRNQALQELAGLS